MSEPPREDKFEEITAYDLAGKLPRSTIFKQEFLATLRRFRDSLSKKETDDNSYVVIDYDCQTNSIGEHTHDLVPKDKSSVNNKGFLYYFGKVILAIDKIIPDDPGMQRPRL